MAARKKARKTTAKKKSTKKTAKKTTAKKATAKKTTTKKSTTKKKATRKKAAGGKSLSKGDKVSWSSLNGPSTGKVAKKITGKTKIKSHTVEASPEKPQFLVKSDKTGKKAAHKAKSLRKRG